ncbi:MAG: glycosyltransferase family 2 protein [Proteobacteria bacterium]|nr:glycosyltransferase family 2 protein [Pseudomonadota bacterium]
MTDIDICLCTFRRPQVTDCLRSLGKLVLPAGKTARIIVADNDETPSGRDAVEEASRSLDLPIMYTHAPARNISIARNACLDVAAAPLVAFLDDDEQATPGWIAELIKTLDETGADAVLGPVRALYPQAAPNWMKKGDFHATLPVWVNGQIITGYTCNVLLRRTSPALKGLRFREALGRSGGEDTTFFREMHQAGGKIAFAPEAWLTEEVPPQRLRLQWLALRRFRSGQTHGMLLLEQYGTNPAARAKQIAKAAAKAAYCGLMALLTALSPVRRNFWILRGALHVGAISRLLGGQELVQYG